MTSNSNSTHGVSKLDYVLAILFVVFALVQYNDPDGLLWGAVYLVIAAVCIFYRRLPLMVLNVIVILFAISLMSYFPSMMSWVNDGMPSVVESMKAESPYIEMVREAGGLLIGVVVLIYYRFKAVN